MNIDWIEEVLRDLVQFAQLNQMPRLARDLERAMTGLQEETHRAAPSAERAEAEAVAAVGPEPVRRS